MNNNMQPGDIVAMERFTSFHGSRAKGETYVTFQYTKLSKNRTYQFLFLGAGSVEEPLDGNRVMNALGWVYDPKRANQQLAERRD